MLDHWSPHNQWVALMSINDNTLAAKNFAIGFLMRVVNRTQQKFSANETVEHIDRVVSTLIARIARGGADRFLKIQVADILLSFKIRTTKVECRMPARA